MLVVIVVLHLPARLAGHADSVAGRAGVAHWNIHPLSDVFGFSINTLSLFGLVLAIGLVVDDAIVVVEAVERHIEEGLAPKEAAFKAMEEVSGPGGGHRVDLGGGVCPDGFHSRASRGGSTSNSR